MKFDVYCDESRPDVLFSEKIDSEKYMVLGSLWLSTDDRDLLKTELHLLRHKHGISKAEAKWQKVSPNKFGFYEDVIKWFVSKKETVRFRCLAVTKREAELLRFRNQDKELAFYRFYYQLLHNWIRNFNEYSIFCDFKQNKEKDRLEVLRSALDYGNLTSEISRVQPIRSKESVLLQVCDILTGIAAAKLNAEISPESSKGRLIAKTEELLGSEINATHRYSKKFNVFVMNIKGGW